MDIQEHGPSIAIAGEEEGRYHREPITFGVPFAEGALTDSSSVRIVSADGSDVPAQTSCMTTWRPDGDSIKWLLVDLQRDGTTDEAEPLQLIADSTHPPAPSPEALQISEEDGRIHIDTGVMRAVFRTEFRPWQHPRTPAFMTECSQKSADGWQSVMGDTGPVLYMRDQHGNEYDSLRLPPQVSLEESGPLRACILVRGFLASQAGVRFCEYQLRIHLFAGKSDLRICHTFIFDQDPHLVELSAVGLRLPVDVGGSRRAMLGGSDSTHHFDDLKSVALLQPDHQRYTVQHDGEAAAEGKRAPGWACLTGESGSAIACVRDFWQEHPKGLRIDEDGMDIGIWPEAHDDALAFTTPYTEPELRFSGQAKRRDEDDIVRLMAERPTAPLHLKSLGAESLEDVQWVEDVMSRRAAGRPMTYSDLHINNGVGAAKTTEILIRFSSSPADDANAEATSKSFQTPLIAVVDPAYMSNSGAINHFYPAGDERFKQADADLDDYFDPIVVEPVEKCGLYGMMRFGNMVCHHSSAVGWVYLLYKDTEPEKALRYIGPYNNEANDQIMATWGQYLRTGDPAHRRIAERYSRSVADVAFVHAYPGKPERIGLMHYHNGHQWSGCLSPSHSVVSGILTDYYITGNRRLLDVAREAGDCYVRTQEPAGILSCRTGWLHREFTGPLSILLDMYEATWEEKYGLLAEHSLSWLLRTVRTPGMLPNGIFMSGPRGNEAVVTFSHYPELAWGNKYHLYAPALRNFRSKELEEFVIAEADYWVWESPRDLLNYACSTVCFAYDLTGDVTYAAYAKDLIDTNFHDFIESMRKEEQLDFAAMRFSGYIPRLMRIVATAMDKDPEGFAAACEAWKRERATRPDRPEEERPDSGPRTSLGVLSCEPLAKMDDCSAEKNHNR
ncbi:hypothetical protein ACFL34_01895 [Candidatus Sumerlaeota bacterium]